MLDLNPSKFLLAPSSNTMPFDLTLLQRPPDAAPFRSDETYQVWFTHFSVFGYLGAFWHTERTPASPPHIQYPGGRVLTAISLGRLPPLARPCHGDDRWHHR
jgi:hypothetical protein